MVIINKIMKLAYILAAMTSLSCVASLKLPNVNIDMGDWYRGVDTGESIGPEFMDFLKLFDADEFDGLQNTLRRMFTESSEFSACEKSAYCSKAIPKELNNFV